MYSDDGGGLGLGVGRGWREIGKCRMKGAWWWLLGLGLAWDWVMNDVRWVVVV